MRIILSLIVFIIFIKFSFAQENYLRGNIVLHNGDTIDGYIDSKNWDINPGKIHFKAHLDTNAIVYRPLEIKGFYVSDEYYLSGIVKSEISGTTTISLKEDPTLNIKVDTIFLQALFRGPKSLYVYKNSNGRENFYIQHESDLDLLIYKRYKVQSEGQSLITENNKYIGQLSLYLKDCPNIQQELKRISYSKKSLLRLFEDYYECAGSEPSYAKKEEKIIAKMGFLAGISSTKVRFKGSGFKELANADLGNSVNAAGGLFVDFILPRNNGKWSIYNELIYSSYHLEGGYSSSEYKKATIELGLGYININNMIRYKYPLEKLFFFVNAGLSNGFAISSTNSLQLEYFHPDGEGTYTGKALNEIRKYETSLIFGTGLHYNSLTAEIRMEKGNGISPYFALKSSTSKIFLLVGLRLN